MNKPSPHRSKKSSAQQTARLGVYLAAGLGVSGAAMSTSEAALITININPSGFDIDGVDAGLANNGSLVRTDFPLTGAGRLQVFNGANGGFWGLYADRGLSFASGGSTASPSKFSLVPPLAVLQIGARIYTSRRSGLPPPIPQISGPEATWDSRPDKATMAGSK